MSPHLALSEYLYIYIAFFENWLYHPHLLAPSLCLNAELGTPWGPRGSDSITWRRDSRAAWTILRRSDNSTISTYVSWIDLLAEVWRELALLERVEVDGCEDQGNHPAHGAVDSEDHLRSWKYLYPCQTLSNSIQLTVCFYEHPTKDSATESTKAMVDTLAGKEIFNNRTHLNIEANTLTDKVKLSIVDR